MHLDTRDGCGEAIATLVCASENAEKVEEVARREMGRVVDRSTTTPCFAAGRRSPPRRCSPTNDPWAG